MAEEDLVEEGFTIKIGDLVSLFETESKSYLFADFSHVSGRPKPQQASNSIDNFQGS
jgi:hypothetical protein